MLSARSPFSFSILRVVARQASVRVVLLAGVAVVAASVQAHALVVVGNHMIGVFSNPVLSGNVLNDPSIGQTMMIDNSTTAVTTGSGTSTITWGTNPAGAAQATGNFSSLTFNGTTGLPLDSTTPIRVGTITFYNGTSALNSLIFGATVSFYENSVNPSNLLGSDTVYINTTSNQYSGTGLTNAQLQTDADYINICGNSSNICGSSIESYESTEVGAGYVPLTVDLYATYQYDPHITLTSVTLDSSNPGDGVIGIEAAASVPEPASLALLGASLLGLANIRRRTR